MTAGVSKPAAAPAVPANETEDDFVASTERDTIAQVVGCGVLLQSTLKASDPLDPFKGITCRLELAICREGTVAEIEPFLAAPDEKFAPVPCGET
jgi:hypothetical protein